MKMRRAMVNLACVAVVVLMGACSQAQAQTKTKDNAPANLTNADVQGLIDTAKSNTHSIVMLTQLVEQQRDEIVELWAKLAALEHPTSATIALTCPLDTTCKFASPVPKWEQMPEYGLSDMTPQPLFLWTCEKDFHAYWPNHIKHVLYETSEDDPPVCVADGVTGNAEGGGRTIIADPYVDSFSNINGKDVCTHNGQVVPCTEPPKN